MLLDLSIKGFPAERCELANESMNYKAVIKHLANDCKQIKGSCVLDCGKQLLRNEIDDHMNQCPNYVQREK
jgi:hypothetical protein